MDVYITSLNIFSDFSSNNLLIAFFYFKLGSLLSWTPIANSFILLCRSEKTLLITDYVDFWLLPFWASEGILFSSTFFFSLPCISWNVISSHCLYSTSFLHTYRKSYHIETHKERLWNISSLFLVTFMQKVWQLRFSVQCWIV